MGDWRLEIGDFAAGAPIPVLRRFHSVTGHSYRRAGKRVKAGHALAALLFIFPICKSSAADPIGAVVDAIRLVESGGANVPGDGGRAAGEWQLHAGACRDAGAAHAEAWQPERAREIATAYVTWLRGELAERLRRDPTAGEIYAAYNLGLKGFCRRGLRLARCPRVTRERAAMVAAGVRRRADEAEQAVLDRRYNELVEAGRRLAATKPHEQNN